jgi:hypothetical protein
MKITQKMLEEMVKKELQQEISKEKLRALGLAGGLAVAGAAGYGIGKAAGPYVDKMLAQEPYSVTSHTPPAEYGSAEYPAGGDVMPVEVGDAMDQFEGMPEFSDKMSLRAAIDSVAMSRKPLTYEAVKAEYDSIVGEPGAMRENKIKVSASKLDAMINEELKRVLKESMYTLTQDIKLGDEEMGSNKGIFNLKKGYYKVEIDESDPKMVVIFTEEGGPVSNPVKRDWFRMAKNKGIFVDGQVAIDRSYSYRSEPK